MQINDRTLDDEDENTINLDLSGSLDISQLDLELSRLHGLQSEQLHGLKNLEDTSMLQELNNISLPHNTSFIEHPEKEQHNHSVQDIGTRFIQDLRNQASHSLT